MTITIALLLTITLIYWRRDSWSDWRTRVVQTTQIDVPSLYEYREKSSPGTVATHPDAIYTTDRPYITYTSSSVASYDYLIESSTDIQSWTKLLRDAPLPDGIQTARVTRLSSGDMIYESEHMTVIVLKRPIDEIYRYNTIYNFEGVDRSKLEGRSWLHISIIRT